MPKVKSQVSMDDKIVNKLELEKLLEKRQGLKAGLVAYREVDKEAKEKLSQEPTPPPYRIGRFIISKNARPPPEVNFTTEASESISISLADAKE